MALFPPQVREAMSEQSLAQQEAFRTGATAMLTMLRQEAEKVHKYNAKWCVVADPEK